MRNHIIVLAIMASAGCSGGAVTPVEPPLSWATLKDGSRLAIGNTEPNAREASSLIRCWKSGAAYDCVAIKGDEWKDVRRTAPKSLPTSIWGAEVPVGYDCSIGGVASGYQEHISGPAGQLTQHVAASLMGPLERGWSKDYVDRYMAANDVRPETLWFDCRAMSEAVQAGSNATIGSTSVDRDLMDGHARATR